jgi:hypothetical protein
MGNNSEGDDRKVGLQADRWRVVVCGNVNWPDYEG